MYQIEALFIHSRILQNGYFSNLIKKSLHALFNGTNGQKSTLQTLIALQPFQFFILHPNQSRQSARIEIFHIAGK